MAVIDTNFIVAGSSLLVAALTGYLALGTRQLAVAAATDLRSQWRPVLIAADNEVDEHIEGELRIRLRNVGRGPALGVHGQLRNGGSKGATFPGEPDTILPQEILELRFSRDEDYLRGGVLQFEIWYYDIGEWWHATEVHASLRQQEDGSNMLRVSRSQVSEPGTRRAFPKGSSHAARLVHPQPRLRRLQRRIGQRISG